MSVLDEVWMKCVTWIGVYSVLLLCINGVTDCISMEWKVSGSVDGAGVGYIIYGGGYFLDFT